MKFTRNANAQWKGSGKEGKGHLTTGSKTLDAAPYTFVTRFEDANKGTNPEELIGAAHAGCYAMQLSFLLGEEGFTPNSLDVDAEVSFEDGSITKVMLNLKGDVPKIDAEQFQQIATKAKEVCPVSKLLDTKIELKVALSS
ncbi:OsmC family protein [Subsaximicrobium wynnwilliamsii]|uniref:OsmC family protein n=1 Tax=Subsaximicrobium wynnwilliamsii TaxID=291179 RepID=A0A5C6ZFY9_9FLAO|nr:OsmC family protein [Subsaximicrobium wynnwilliamsii]TXD84069.1 OsmC family protein [Subsaximicrobium wynnwilliamsii]TXD88973.1 OsmC family protein [Subsaximicrobium wynnwilliamsii]TXE03781.1 OsmC family protein [Subsaximicrobium wynnwilliamsii]